MFDHVKFGVSDFAASKAFYLKAAGRVVGCRLLVSDDLELAGGAPP